VPKTVSRRPRPLVEKPWTCPSCGAALRTTFDGETVNFTHLGGRFAACGGTYETVQVKCPKCGEQIEFTKEELEKPEEA